MNNFREWLSDNLRYILLILGIAAILVGCFFGIRALSGLYTKGTKSADISADSLVSTAVTPAPEADKSTSTSKAAVTPTATPTPTAAATATPTPTAAPTPVGGTLQLNTPPEVTTLVTTYYTALQNKDTDLMKTVVDSLSDADSSEITGANDTVYTDIAVYTKTGADADSYIVYSTYNYQNQGDPVSFPGLSQLYVKKQADASYKIMMGAYDEATQKYIDSVNSSEDVKTLTEQVQTAYASAESAAEDAKAKAESDAAAAQAKAESDAAAAQAKAESDAAAAQDAADATASAAASAETPATIISTCNVRSGPGYENGVIHADLPAGTAVTVIGRTDAGWLHIRTGDIDGYVGGRFVRF